MASESTQIFGLVMASLEEELDWHKLGDAYCSEGGENFFPAAQREAMRDAGLRFAADLAALFDELPDGSPGRSLYLGAALAELSPILFEVLVAGREAVWRNIPSPEAEELNRALEAVGRRLSVELPRVRTDGESDPGPFDHLWCVSVLTDPDAFPALHDQLYQRGGSPLATGKGDLDTEAAAAEVLVSGLLDRCPGKGILTTTDEELGFFERACGQRGWGLQVPDRGRLSGIVGDVVRHCRLR